MAYQGEPIRSEGLTARMHRLDALRVAYGQLERQELGLRTLELLLKHQDWIDEGIGEAANDQWEQLAREVVHNIGKIWDLSAPAQEGDDSAPF